MNISVIGTGYVGLVSGACLAEKGHRVVCVDIDQEKVDMVNKGIPPIHEKGLAELLTK
ncbi:MAG: 3-hydroxyacyl-CoA dehydrogenase NAD-binding domain-containing protein, partial [Thermodesulfobacteriota bacterium]